jgi:hypothetical protein
MKLSFMHNALLFSQHRRTPPAWWVLSGTLSRLYDGKTS